MIFDEESLIENLEPGALASGLAAGYKILYNESRLKDYIMGTVRNLPPRVCNSEKEKKNQLVCTR